MGGIVELATRQFFSYPPALGVAVGGGWRRAGRPVVFFTGRARHVCPNAFRACGHRPLVAVPR